MCQEMKGQTDEDFCDMSSFFSLNWREKHEREVIQEIQDFFIWSEIIFRPNAAPVSDQRQIESSLCITLSSCETQTHRECRDVLHLPKQNLILCIVLLSFMNVTQKHCFNVVPENNSILEVYNHLGLTSLCLSEQHVTHLPDFHMLFLLMKLVTGLTFTQECQTLTNHSWD